MPSSFKKGLPALLIAILSATGAKSAPADTTTEYFTSGWKKTVADSAHFVRKSWKEKKGWHVLEFYPNGQLRMDTRYSDKAFQVHEGLMTRYYDNGQLSRKATYKGGKEDGDYTAWLKDGKVFEELHYRRGDLDGKQTWYHSNGRKSEEGTYKRGKARKSTFWTAEGTVDPQGKPDDIQPTFAGTGGLSAYLQRTVHYPDNSRETGEAGKSLIEFVVEEDGSINECRVVKSTGFAALDGEARRVVCSMPPWNPGFSHNRRVRTYFTLPITFALE